VRQAERSAHVLPVHLEIGELSRVPDDRGPERVRRVLPQSGGDAGDGPAGRQLSQPGVGLVDVEATAQDQRHDEPARRSDRREQVPGDLLDGPLPAQAGRVQLLRVQGLDQVGDPSPFVRDHCEDIHTGDPNRRR
jgi:hypothetical protein